MQVQWTSVSTPDELQKPGRFIIAVRPWRVTNGAEIRVFMNVLQTPKQNKTRSFLRVAGVVTVVLGLIFELIGLASFASAFNHGGLPKLFWCSFVGMPFLFAGSVMCMFGFMGAVARYAAAEQVPVASDAINDLAEGTQGALKKVVRAVAEGVKEAQAEKQR